MQKFQKRNNITQASGVNYFTNRYFPLAVKPISPGLGSSHNFDLTTQFHSHDFSELVVIYDGTAIHYINDLEYTVQKNDLFLLHGDNKHAFENMDQQFKLINIQFSLTGLSLPLRYLKQLPGFNGLFCMTSTNRNKKTFKNYLTVNNAELDALLKLISTLEAELQHRHPGYEFRSLNILMQIIMVCCRNYSNTAQPQTGAMWQLDKLLQHIDNDLTAPWTLQRMTELAGTSPSTLLRLFRREFDCTPVNYIMRKRLEYSLNFLDDPRSQIVDVAERCGFSDSNYFSKCFKKFYGITPGEFRKKS